VSLENRDPPLPVGVLVLDVDHERAGTIPANVEEAQAALVVLVLLFGLLDDPRILSGLPEVLHVIGG
jgi:hypothetical protein